MLPQGPVPMALSMSGISMMDLSKANCKGIQQVSVAWLGDEVVPVGSKLRLWIAKVVLYCGHDEWSSSIDRVEL